jgi:hypothetical protein
MDKLLGDVRSNKEFNDFRKAAKDYKDTEDYKKKVTAKQDAVKAAIRTQTAAIIKNFFNNQKKEGFDPENAKLTVNIGSLDDDDIKGLCVVLKEKGYFHKIENQRLTIECIDCVEPQVVPQVVVEPVVVPQVVVPQVVPQVVQDPKVVV